MEFCNLHKNTNIVEKYTILKMLNYRHRVNQNLKTVSVRVKKKLYKISEDLKKENDLALR